MIVSRGRGYIFVHIPKTGGTAMAQALEARSRPDDLLIGDTPEAQRRRGQLKGVQTTGRLWKHAGLADLPGLVSEAEMRELFVFTLVRNPWDRMVSYYHWLRAQRWDHPAVRLARAAPFAPFLADPTTQRAVQRQPYGSYVRLADGSERCDAFVRLEAFKTEIRPVETVLGHRIALPGRVNASARPRDWRVAYTDETADLVARLCAEDINRFGYRFEGDGLVRDLETP